MLEGNAFVAIVTAAITSTFVARAEHLQDAATSADEAKRDASIESSLEVAQRLDRIETMLCNLIER